MTGWHKRQQYWSSNQSSMADLQPEQYAYRQDRSTLGAVRKTMLRRWLCASPALSLSRTTPKWPWVSIGELTSILIHPERQLSIRSFQHFLNLDLGSILDVDDPLHRLISVKGKGYFVISNFEQKVSGCRIFQETSVD